MASASPRPAKGAETPAPAPQQSTPQMQAEMDKTPQQGSSPAAGKGPIFKDWASI